MLTSLTPKWFALTPNGMLVNTQAFLRFDNVRLNEGVYYFAAPYVKTKPISDHSSRKSASLRYRDDLFQLKAVLDGLQVSCMITQDQDKNFIVLIGREVYHNPSFKIDRDGSPIVWETRSGFVTIAYRYTADGATNVIDFIDTVGNTDSIVGSIKNCLPVDLMPFKHALLLAETSNETFSASIPILFKSWNQVPRTGLLEMDRYATDGGICHSLSSTLTMSISTVRPTVKTPVIALQHSLHV